MAVPKRVADRISSNLRGYRDVLQSAKARDVSEADTVTIVKDILSDVFGFDKYTELTGEFAIRGTYCDLAIRVDNIVARLIEVKAIGIALNANHLRQAINYGANAGIEWIILTNGISWQVHHLLFKKPVETSLVIEFNLLEVETRRKEEIERLYLLTREALQKQALKSFKKRQDAVNRYVLAALLLHNDSIESVMRRELYRCTNVRVSTDEVRALLREEVLKRDALEGEKAEHAAKSINRTEAQRKKKKASKVAANHTGDD